MIPKELNDSLFEACGVPNIPDFKLRMETLHQTLIEVNAKVNLTRIISDEGFWCKHVMDSLLIARAYPEAFQKGTRWLDLGCGGGFPSLVLVNAFPQIHITAMDSIAKKTHFVQSAGNLLGCKNLTVVTGRGRELSCKKEFQARFDILTARAVAEPARIILEAGKMVRPNGNVILYQTPIQIAEVTQGMNPCFRDGMKWTHSEVFKLPLDSGDRQFLYGENF